MKRTVVVGGGLAGLVTARKLIERDHEVTVVEATDRLGGQVHTIDFHGLRVDVGAEAMFTGGPQLPGLLRELGLADDLVAPTAGRSWLRTSRARGGTRLVHLPEGVGPSGPTRLLPVLRSGLLTPLQLARAGMEPVKAKPISGDISVGDFVTRRFGRAVTETFVDPLLGNLHAGDVFRLSLLSTAAQLAPTAREGRSLIWKRRPAHPPATPQAGRSPSLPMFASFPEGLGRLIDALALDIPVRLSAPVRGLTRTGEQWLVHAGDADLVADQVVLAVPARASAELLRPLGLDTASEALADAPVADVATVLLAYSPAVQGNPAISGGNGILLNSRSGRITKAATFLSRKWSHLAGQEVFLVRASVGRAGVPLATYGDDETIATRVHTELSELLGLDQEPLDHLVTRWMGAYPQLEVGHGERMRQVREALAGQRIELVGSAYDGLGMPSVIKSALAAVDRLGE